MMSQALRQLTALSVVGLLVGLSLCLVDVHGHADGTLDLCLLALAILIAESLNFSFALYWSPLPSLPAAGIGLVPGRRSRAPI